MLKKLRLLVLIASTLALGGCFAYPAHQEALATLEVLEVTGPTLPIATGSEVYVALEPQLQELGNPTEIGWAAGGLACFELFKAITTAPFAQTSGSATEIHDGRITFLENPQSATLQELPVKVMLYYFKPGWAPTLSWGKAIEIATNYCGAEWNGEYEWVVNPPFTVKHVLDATSYSEAARASGYSYTPKKTENAVP